MCASGGSPSRVLPAVVREGTVGFRHTVHVLFVTHGGTAVVRRVEDLVGELVDHRLFVAGTRGLDQPTDGQGGATLGADFDGHLVGGTTDAARANFDHGTEVID